MPCDGGVGRCIGCDEIACLRESGFCSDYCEQYPEFTPESEPEEVEA